MYDELIFRSIEFHGAQSITPLSGKQYLPFTESFKTLYYIYISQDRFY